MVWVRIFGKSANYYYLANNHLLPSFLASSSPCPCSIPSDSPRKDFSSSIWLVKVLDFVYFWSSVVYNSVTLCFSDRFLQQKFIWISCYMVFQIVVRGVGGGGIGNFTGGIFLMGEVNLRRSGFNQLKSKLTWPKFSKSMRWNRNNDYS